MRKFLLSLASVLLSVSAMAEPVTLTFRDYNSTSSDSGTAFTTESLIDSLQNAADFVTCTETSKCYPARIDMGCKLGTGSATGTFTLSLVTPAEFEKIVVSAASYSKTEGKLTIQGGEVIDLTDGGESNKVLRDLEYVPTEQVTTFTVATTEKRAYIKSITFYPKAAADQPAFADGDYLIVNKATQAYLGGGLDWGTHATLIGKPQWFTLTATEGAYTLDSHQSNGGESHFLGTGLYVDAAAAPWNLVVTENGVTIENGGNYLAGTAANAAISTVTDGTAESAMWQLISKDEFLASLQGATKNAPVDATALIYDPEFKRNGNTSGYWKITGFDGTGNPTNFAQGQNDNTASCGESYHSGNGFKAVQTIHLPYAGVYKLSAQAFYRKDGGDEELPYLFAGDKKSNFPEKTGTENNMVEAYAAFLAKTYTVEPVVINVVAAQDIEIGVAGAATSMWNIFGELELTYCGEDLDAAAAQTLADYNELLDKKMNNEVMTAMTEAYNAYNANQTKETLSALAAAVATAKTSVAQYEATKAALDACDVKVANLTTSGKAKYNELVGAIKTAYEEGTLDADKSADVNAAYITAVKAQTEAGASMLDAAPSAWTGATGMLPPNWANATPYTFAEHYQQSAIAAGEVLTQTIEELPAGNYEVTLALAASFTSGRGFEAATGEGIAAGFANDQEQGITVVERTSLAADAAEVVTLTVAVADGKLTYGLKNVAEGGNWYAAAVTAITYQGTPEVTLVESDLTKDMFHTWTAADTTATLADDQSGTWCDYVLGSSTGMPYGNGNVNYLQFADLTAYTKLVITVTEGTPRCIFNRIEDNGTVNAETPRDAEYQTVEDNVYTIDIAKIVEKYGFAHLHAIKGANWANVTVTSMKLYAPGEAGIEAVETEVMQNGIFDLQGRQVSEMKAGQIYLVGGKKVIVK